jgi:hypothetical protein
MANRFEDHLIAMVDEGVEFVVAGGVACVLQGVDAFLHTMKRSGLTPRAMQTARTAWPTPSRRVSWAMTERQPVNHSRHRNCRCVPTLDHA